MGLEDNPDFWDMGIDDEGEEIVAMKDLTKQSSLFPVSRIFFSHLLVVHFEADSNFHAKKTNMKHANRSVPTILEVLDSQPVEPKKLPNGNYQ